MVNRIGRFRTQEIADRYYRIYDDMVANHWPVPRQEIDVPTRYGPTHVRRSGPDTGTPLVMIHPTAGSSLGWHTVIGPLAERYPIYTPDTIGTAGRSIQQEPIRTASDLSVWLGEVLDALELESVHLCGYSEGGWIAAVHAAETERTDRLASLTLIEPVGAIERVSRALLASMIVRASATLIARDKRRAIRKFSRWLNGDIELSDDEIELVLFVFGNFRQKLPKPDRLADERLRGITAATLLMLGSDTRLLDPGKVAERTERLMPKVTVEITPGAGHGLPFQYPGRTTERILEFVGEIAP